LLLAGTRALHAPSTRQAKFTAQVSVLVQFKQWETPVASLVFRSWLTRLHVPVTPFACSQKPFYNQSSEIHATLKESLTALEPHLTFNGTASGLASGFVPGRPVLEVPGWKERYPQPAAAHDSYFNSLSRLRIFSGTSNPVGDCRLNAAVIALYSAHRDCIK
jgi:hypothetical protein